MFKVLVIILVLGFVFFRVMGFFMRLLTGSTATHKQDRTRSYQQSKNAQPPKGGNVNVDFVPSKKKGDQFNGGEYVEFEDVD